LQKIIKKNQLLDYNFLLNFMFITRSLCILW